MVKILFVDSNSYASQKMNAYLHQAELSFIFTNSGGSGLELMRNENVDIIISHLGVHDQFDDIEFMLMTKEIKPKIPVILILPDLNPDKSDKLLRAGAFACLDETVSGEKILGQIKSAIHTI